MKKFIFSLVASVYLFGYIIPTYADAAHAEEQINELHDSLPAITGTQAVEVTSVDIENAEAQTNDVIGQEIEENLEITSEVVDETAIIETGIESDELNIDSSLELDLETSEMTVETELEDENGNIQSKSFDVAVTEVNGEDFSAMLTDLETGEVYEVNTAEVNASWYPLVVIAISVARYGINYAIKKYGRSAVTKATNKYGQKATAKTLKNLKFASERLLSEHWDKHKKEFPGYTKSKYLTRAQSLAGTTAKHILTKKRSNGDILKYNKDTNELLILTKDDVIKTLFKPKYPNKNRGYEYFKNQ